MNLQQFIEKARKSQLTIPLEFKQLLDSEFRSSKSSGVTYSLIFRHLTRIAVLKYITLDTITNDYAKIKSQAMNDKLVKLGLLSDGLTYSITPKCRKFLMDMQLDMIYLPSFTGQGDKDSIMNSKQLIQCFDLPDFYCLYYPNFDYLKPDALLIRKNDKYKLDFIEIEKDKGNHEQYLLDKKNKYLKLAHSDDVFKWWCLLANELGLRSPLIDEFKFNVVVVTEKNFDFGEGFKFVHNLSELK